MKVYLTIPRRGAEDRLSPSCKIRLGTKGGTSRVSTSEFTVSRHENRSCKYTEDMYRDVYINMTPTRCSVIITSESGDELINLRGRFIGRAEQHSPQHYGITVRTSCTTSKFAGEHYSGSFGKSCTRLYSVEGLAVDRSYSNRVSWMPLSSLCFQY